MDAIGVFVREILFPLSYFCCCFGELDRENSRGGHVRRILFGAVGGGCIHSFENQTGH